MKKNAKTLLVLCVTACAAALTGCQTTSRETLFQLGGFKVEREVKSGGLRGLITGNQSNSTSETVTLGRKRVEVRDDGPSFGDLLLSGGQSQKRRISVTTGGK